MLIGAILVTVHCWQDTADDEDLTQPHVSLMNGRIYHLHRSLSINVSRANLKKLLLLNLLLKISFIDRLNNGIHNYTTSYSDVDETHNLI